MSVYHSQTSDALDALFRSSDADPWGHHWRGSLLYRRRVAADFLRSTVGHAERVLDLGCAAGDTTSDIVQAVGARSTLALDVSAEAITRAQRRFGHLEGVTFVSGDVPAPGPWHAPVDLVTCSLVFEYLDDAELAAWLAMLRRGPLGEGGRLYVLRAVRPGNKDGIDEGAFFEQMRAGGFRPVAVRHLYGRLANLDRWVVGYLAPGPHRVRRALARPLRPVIGSVTVARIAHTLGRGLLGRRAIDLVAAVFEQTH